VNLDGAIVLLLPVTLVTAEDVPLRRDGWHVDIKRI
jgi:hypothetical protein